MLQQLHSSIFNQPQSAMSAIIQRLLEKTQAALGEGNIFYAIEIIDQAIALGEQADEPLLIRT